MRGSIIKSERSISRGARGRMVALNKQCTLIQKYAICVNCCLTQTRPIPNHTRCTVINIVWGDNQHIHLLLLAAVWTCQIAKYPQKIL